MSLFRVGADGLVGRRVAAVPGHKVTAQMGNGVSEHLVVHFVRFEAALQGLRATHDGFEEQGALVPGQLARCADVALTNQHAVAPYVLVAAQPEPANLHVRDGMPVLVGNNIGCDRVAQRAVVAADERVLALKRHPSRARIRD